MDHHRQRVLVAAAQGAPLQLFGRGVEHGALEIGNIGNQAIRDCGGAEVVKHDPVLLGEQHILRLDIAMHKLMLMHILERVGDLPDVSHDDPQRQTRATWMALAQGAMGYVVHNEIRYIVIRQAKVVNMDDVRMVQLAEHSSLRQEALDIAFPGPGMQQLDRHGLLKPGMLPQKNLGRIALTEQAQHPATPNFISRNTFANAHALSFIIRCAWFSAHRKDSSHLFICFRRENHEVFSFVDEAPSVSLFARARVQTVIQKTPLARVMRISIL